MLYFYTFWRNGGHPDAHEDIYMLGNGDYPEANENLIDKDLEDNSKRFFHS